jgi:two-component system OmpR family sensor kinase
MSLRLRLTLFFAGVLAVSLLAFSALLYVMLDHALALDVDSAIASKAEDVARTSRIRGEYPLQPRRIRLPRIDAFAAPEIYIQLLDAEGQVVDRSANLGEHRLPLTEVALASGRQGQSWYDTISLDGQPLRVYTAPLLVDDDVIGFIQVARSLSDNEQTLAHVQRLLLLCDTLVVGVAAAIGWVLARASLRPLDRVVEAARAIGHSGQLDRRLDPPRRQDEVGRLVATFNEMLDRLEAMFNAQRRFVADASHELRTPLTTIRGNVELLRRGAALPPEDVEEALADIASEAERMSRLVTDLLRLARADAGQGLAREPVRLDVVLRDVHRQVQRHKPDTRVLLGPTPPALVLGSRDALQELLLILVDNGLKYTPPGGEVELGLRTADGWHLVSVRDTGVGIDPADLPHIFERFYRATRARQQGGTGLGLAIARWLAEQHDGRITVESTPGRGSTFTVWLPVLEGEPAAIADAQAAEPVAHQMPSAVP